MAPYNDSVDGIDSVDYLITVLMTADNFKPDWVSVAEMFGINTSSNAQRRFKSIVEKSGKFECKKNVITIKGAPKPIAVSSSGTTSRPATSAASKGQGARKRAAPAPQADGPKGKKVKKGKKEAAETSCDDEESTTGLYKGADSTDEGDKDDDQI